MFNDYELLVLTFGNTSSSELPVLEELFLVNEIHAWVTTEKNISYTHHI